MRPAALRHCLRFAPKVRSSAPRRWTVTVRKAELEAIARGEAEADVDSIYRLAGSLDVSPGALCEGVVWVPDGEGGGEYRGGARSED